MTSRAALSPAWLGLFAALSFAGLVLASFASGYHLVMRTAPRSELAPDVPAASAASPGGVLTAAASATAGAVGTANGSLPGGPLSSGPGSSGPKGSAASGAATRGTASADPTEATVRPNLRPDRALVRSQPESGAVVGRLPSNQRVALRGRRGDWLHVEFERRGKHVDGWTQEANLQLR